MTQKENDSGKKRPKWKEQAGLADETTSVRVYPTETQKAEWKDEANQQELSLSKYVISMVEESRTIQELDSNHQIKSSREKELKEKIQSLETELEKKSQITTPELIDENKLLEVLGDKARSLDEIVRILIENGYLKQEISRVIENTLYRLAENGRVEYDRSSPGWRRR